ncbi:Uncharacterized protein APZ42_033523 [Daphnia magna]|uniref:Peptidase A2 domain-containing protein n=1 Tax=Daphnia magna TaxID=35525 RepID=A0A164KZV4_9CRUS|nr:Uncharacterized protein APZ42_033523 [Daphnia magna]
MRIRTLGRQADREFLKVEVQCRPRKKTYVKSGTNIPITVLTRNCEIRKVVGEAIMNSLFNFYYSAGAKFAGCWNCGSKTRCKPLTACPAQGKECNKCGLLNHYFRVCRNPKTVKKQQGIYIDPSPPTVGAVNASDLVELAVNPEKWTSSLLINFLPDTGADLDAIPESLYKRKLSKVALQKGPTIDLRYSAAMTLLHLTFCIGKGLRRSIHESQDTNYRESGA